MNRLLAKLFIITTLFFSFVLSSFAAGTYTLDPLHTYVLWHANHFGFSIQSGKFTQITGTITLDESKPQNSKVSVTIPIANLATGIPKFDQHLKSDEFLDVAKFPTATFVSDKVDVTSKKTGKIYGTLTLHGVSKPVVLNATLLKMGTHPMNNKKSLGFSATTTIKRSDFGITMYVPSVSDEVKIDIGAEANLANQ